MAVTTSTRDHVLTHPNNLGPNWYNSFVQYAQTVTDYLDNPDIIALTEIQDNATSAKICLFTHVAAGTRLDFRNAAAGSGAEVGVISSNANETLKITPKGAGRLKLDGSKLPAADGTANYWLQTDGSGSLSFVPRDIVYDPSPTLVANLQLDTYKITAGGTDFIQFTSANDIVLKLGDAAGAKKVKITDSADAERLSITSDGLVTPVSLTVTDTTTVTTVVLQDEAIPLDDLDVAALPVLTTLDTADYIVVYEDSSTTNKKFLLSNLYTNPVAYAKITDPGGSSWTVTGSGISSASETGSGQITLTMSTTRSNTNYTVFVSICNDVHDKIYSQVNTSTYSTTQFAIYGHLVFGSNYSPIGFYVLVFEG